MVLENMVWTNESLEFVNGSFRDLMLTWQNKTLPVGLSSPTECKAWCVGQMIQLKADANYGYYFLFIPLLLHIIMIVFYFIGTRLVSQSQTTEERLFPLFLIKIALWIDQYGFAISSSLCAAVLTWFIWWRTLV